MLDWFKSKGGYEVVSDELPRAPVAGNGAAPAADRRKAWVKYAAVSSVAATGLALVVGAILGGIYLFRSRSGANSQSTQQTYQLTYALVNNNSDATFTLKFINKENKPYSVDRFSFTSNAVSLSSLQGVFAGANITKVNDTFNVQLPKAITIPAMVNDTVGVVEAAFTVPLPTAPTTLAGALVALPDNIVMGLTNTTNKIEMSYDGSDLVTSSPINGLLGMRLASSDGVTPSMTDIDQRYNSLLAGYAGVNAEGQIIPSDNVANYNNMFWNIDLIQRARDFVDLTIEVNPVDVVELVNTQNATETFVASLKSLKQVTGAKSFLITPTYPKPVTPAFEAALLNFTQTMSDNDCKCDLYLPFNQSLSSGLVSKLDGMVGKFYQPAYDATPYSAGQPIRNMIPDQSKLNNTKGISSSKFVPLIPNTQICGEVPASTFNGQFPLNNTASGTTPGASGVYPGIYSQAAIAGQSTNGLNPPPGGPYIFIPSEGNDGVNVINVQTSGTPVVCTGVGDTAGIKTFASKGGNAVVSRLIYDGPLHDTKGVYASTVVANVLEGVDPRAAAPQPQPVNTTSPKADFSEKAASSNTGRKLMGLNDDVKKDQSLVSSLGQTALLAGGTVAIGKAAEDIALAVGASKEEAGYINAGANYLVPLLLIALTSPDKTFALQLALSVMLLMYLLQMALKEAQVSPLKTGLAVTGARVLVGTAGELLSGKGVTEAGINAVANASIGIASALGTNALYEGGRFFARRVVRPTIPSIEEIADDQLQSSAKPSAV